MKIKKAWIWGLVIVIVSLIILIIGFFLYNIKLSPSTNTNLEKCNTLIYNGQAKTNIVFFSDKENAQKYADFFLQTEPFNNNKVNFNFYYIDSYTPKCEIYKNIATLCYSKQLIKVASSCPSDYIVVLDNQEPRIRSSTYMNIISLNIASQLSIFTHEFGHAFSNLADEYVPAEIPSNSKNCVSDCNNFLRDKDGCFKGCSKESYFRSINGGVMRTLSSNDYGLFNKNLILDRISRTKNALTGFAVGDQEVVDCSSQNYYLIEAVYTNEMIDIKDKTLENGCIGSNGYGGFSYSMVKIDGSTLATDEFNPELIFTDIQLLGDEIIQGSASESDRAFLLKVPVIKDAKELQISKDSQLLSQINLNDIGARPCLG